MSRDPRADGFAEGADLDRLMAVKAALMELFDEEADTAHGEDLALEEMDGPDLMWRCRELVNEWQHALPSTTRPAEPAAIVALWRTEKRLEDCALELALYLKAQRLKREDAAKGAGA